MIGNFKGSLALLMLLLLSAPLSAEVTVKMKVTPNRAMVGDTVNLTVSVIGNIAEVTKPFIEDQPGIRRIRTEPQISQSVQIINGVYSRTVDFTYLVSCDKPGTYTIKPPSVEADRKMYTGNAVTLTVLKAGTKKTSGGTIRLEATVIPEQAWVGQAIAVVVRLYVPRSLIGNGRWGWVEKPSGKGFLPEPLGEQGGEWKLASIGGQPTMVLDVGRYVVTPTQPGKYRFLPGTAKVVVRVPRKTPRRRRRGFFDSFFDDDFDSFFGHIRGKEVAVGGEPVEFTVRSLPEASKPAGFSNICAASIEARAGVSRIKLKENESLTYKITVEGQGDLRALKTPKLELGDSFRVFESKSHPSAVLDESGVRSRTVFEYVLVPTNAGKLTLPAVTFVYFDTVLKTYRKATTKAVVLDVVPGEQEEVVTVTNLPSRGHLVKLRGRDINYIREDRRDAIPLSAPPLHRRAEYWLITLLPFFLLLGEAWYRRYTNLSAGDLLERRASRALREAQSGVGKANEKIGDGKQFYSTLRNALVGYLADKLGLSSAGLVFTEIRQTVEEKGVSSVELDAFAYLLEECEMAAFSPALPDEEQRKEHSAEAITILRNIDRGWAR